MMIITKTSILSNSLIWFGAVVSIPEILTDTLLAPLGFIKGTIAISCVIVDGGEKLVSKRHE